jgi:hypothetical protein
MPIYQQVGSDAATLVALLEKALANGEKPTLVQQAGNAWVVVTERKPGPKPKAQTRS